MDPSAATRPVEHRPAVRPAGWWFDAVLLAGFAALTAALAAGLLLDGLRVRRTTARVG